MANTLTDNTAIRGMTKTKLVNRLMIWFIIVATVFGLLYYLALTPDRILYSIVPVTAGKDKVPDFKYAFYGEGDHKLQNPMDLAIKGDKVFISDAGANKIFVFGLNGKYMYSIGKPGAGPGEFEFPYGIGVDSRDRLIVADMKNHRIQVFDSQGKFLSYFPDKSSGDLFSAPGGIFIAKDKLYITDIWKSKILVYDLDGRKLLEFGSHGNDKGQFRYPNGVTADKKGNIYVADTGNQRVQVFDARGQFIREFKGSKVKGVDLTYASPRGIVLMNDELLYVVNSMSSDIWINDTHGQIYNRFGTMGDENTQFNFPNGIKINQNRLYITDTQNHGVKVYGY